MTSAFLDSSHILRSERRFQVSEDVRSQRLYGPLALFVEVDVCEFLSFKPSAFSGDHVGKVHDVLHLVLNILQFQGSRWDFVACRDFLILEYFIQLG